jgi:hypothetical protein
MFTFRFDSAENPDPVLRDEFFVFGLFAPMFQRQPHQSFEAVQIADFVVVGCVYWVPTETGKDL